MSDFMLSGTVKSKKLRTFRVTTNDDCEGKTSKHIGYFKAFSLEQIAEYIVENDIQYTYDYYIDTVDVIDVSHNEVIYVASAVRGRYGRIDVVIRESLKKEYQATKGLAKLTVDEKKALGL